MGVIDIRRRSASLGNVGSLPSEQGIDYSGIAALRNQTESIRARTRGNLLGQVPRLVGAAADLIGDRMRINARINAAIAAREDKRKIDGAIADANSSLNSMMYNIGADGSPQGFMVQAKDVDKGGQIVGDYKKACETILEDVRKAHGLTDQQYDIFKANMDGRFDSWGSQMTRVVGDTYLKSEEQNARSLAQSDFDALVAKPELNEGDWATLKGKLTDRNYLRGKNIVGEGAVAANMQAVIMDADAKRKTIWLKQIENDIEARGFTTEKEVKDYFAEKRNELANKRFITPDMENTLTNAQRKNAKEVMEEHVNAFEKQAVKIAEANLARVQSQAIKADKDAFAQIVLHQDEEGFVPPEKSEKLQSIKTMAGLTDDQRATIYEKWNGYYLRREQFDRDQKTKHGEELEIYDGNGNEKKVYLSAAAWGKTDPTVEARLKDTGYIANNPTEVLSEIEALRATGNISGEDYFSVKKLATAQLDQQTADACSKLFDGKFASIFLAKWGNRPMDEKSYVKGLSTNLYYKRDENAATGFNGSFDRSLTYDALKHRDSETNESVFTMKEKDMLINTVRRLAHRGFDMPQIEKALQEIIAPKERRFYSMKMEERLQDTDFIGYIESMGTLNERIKSRVSAMTGVTGLSGVVDWVDPKKLKKPESKQDAK